MRIIKSTFRAGVAIFRAGGAAILIIFLLSFSTITLDNYYKYRSRLNEAHTSLDLGLAAANNQRWDLALENFNQTLKLADEARELDEKYAAIVFGTIYNNTGLLFEVYPEKSPKDFFPVLYLNLALAYDNKGGSDLIADVWYRAYLASTPEDDNAEEILARIAFLEKNAEALLNKMIQGARENAAMISNAAQRSEAEAAIVEALREAGDLQGADETTAMRIKLDNLDRAGDSAVTYWKSCAMKNQDNPAISNQKGLIESISTMNKEPVEPILKLAESAKEIAAFLKEIRKNASLSE